MIKLNLPLLSQNDARWKSIILGYNPANSSYTIGNYGCLITSLCMYLSAIGKPETPDTINKKLQDNQGFKAGTGLLIWSVFNNLFGVSEYYSSPRYSGPLTPQAYTKIRELLDNKMPVLAEIDFNPSQQGEQMHYVQIVGYDDQNNFYANDPWSGTYINMNVYGSMDTAVYQFKSYNIPVPADTSPSLQYLADAFVSLCNIMSIPLNRDTAERNVRTMIGYEDELKKKDTIIQQKDTQVTEIKQQATQLADMVKALQGDNLALKEANNQLQTKAQANIVKLEEHEKQLADAMDKIQELEKIQPVNSFNGWQLISLGVQKLFGLNRG